MGSYDGAEVCELVGLFMLNLIVPLVCKNNVSLDKGDGLAILENDSDPDSERIKKKKNHKAFPAARLKHLSLYQPRPDRLPRRHV